jgi:hypothetical protein
MLRNLTSGQVSMEGNENSFFRWLQEKLLANLAPDGVFVVLWHEVLQARDRDAS